MFLKSACSIEQILNNIRIHFVIVLLDDCSVIHFQESLARSQTTKSWSKKITK